MTIPFWSITTDQDGSLRISEPSNVWIINFGDLGNLNLVKTQALGRFFIDFATHLELEEHTRFILGDLKLIRSIKDARKRL